MYVTRLEVRVYLTGSRPENYNTLLSPKSAIKIAAFGVTTCAVVQAVANVNRVSNGKWQLWTPYRIDTIQPITKKFVTGDFVGDPYHGYLKFVAHCPCGLQREWVK